MAPDPALEDVVWSGTATTGAEWDHTITVEVDGLSPATTYWYRFTADREESPVGRTRTLPAGPVDVFRIATVCCAHYSAAPLAVYRAVAEREVDLVLHLGDYIYENAGDDGLRRHDPPHPAITRDDYRRRLAQVRADPDLQALHLRHPVVAIWDDHDLADNSWRDGAKHHDITRDGPWNVRVAAAVRARQEWLPARLPDPDRPLRRWRALAVGDLAELVLLDTRLAGRDRQAGDEESPPLDDPQRSLLGDEQRRWLHGRLGDVARPWSIVASGVVVNSIELPWPRSLSWMNGLLANGYAMIDGRVLHDDQWDGYPAERDRMVRWIAERAAAGGRTVLLSGDVHSSWAFKGPSDPATGQPVAVEFTTPAVSSVPMGRARYPGMSRVLDTAARELSHAVWSEVTERGYTILHVSPDEVRSEWWFVDPYAKQPGRTAELAGAFVADRATWPPALVSRDDASSDPVRPGLPAPLPARPDDLVRIRRRRRLRLTAQAGAGMTAAFGAVVTAGVVAHRRTTR